VTKMGVVKWRHWSQYYRWTTVVSDSY